VLTPGWWSALSAVAGALALLIGGVEAAVTGGAPPETADRVGGPIQEAVESRDGRLRIRMTAHRDTAATSLIFEVHLRDRTWMTPDDRLVRIVVRDEPESISRSSRQEIVAATTLPGSATGFTFFRATLDVTRLTRGRYLASVELVGTNTSRPPSPGANVIDRATELYTARDPAITTPCCPHPTQR
jgi:hypothetical protein